MLQEEDLKIGTCFMVSTVLGDKECVLYNIKENSMGKYYHYLTGNFLNFSNYCSCMDIHKCEFSDFIDPELAVVPHFYRLDNLYSVLSMYSNTFDSIDYYKLKGRYVRNGHEDKMSVLRFRKGEKVVEVIVNENTTPFPEYSNPYVWIQEYPSPDDVMEIHIGVDLGMKREFHENNVSIFDLNKISFSEVSDMFLTTFDCNMWQPMFSSMHGLAIKTGNQTVAFVYDLETEKQRVRLGNGTYYNERYNAPF